MERTPRSWCNGGNGSHSGPSRGDLEFGAIRPFWTIAVPRRPTAARPLAGVKVLDLTRVLAGPVATRFLAGYGAEVLRVDPPDWDEPEGTLGKHCARLNLRQPPDRARFRAPHFRGDLFIHGYRPEALELSATEMMFAAPSIRASSTSASTPTLVWPVAKPPRLRQSGSDVDRHCWGRQGVARRRQAGPAAGAGARSRHGLSHGGGSCSWP